MFPQQIWKEGEEKLKKLIALILSIYINALHFKMLNGCHNTVSSPFRDGENGDKKAKMIYSRLQ